MARPGLLEAIDFALGARDQRRRNRNRRRHLNGLIAKIIELDLGNSCLCEHDRCRGRSLRRI